MNEISNENIKYYDQYISKYPDQFHNIMALIYAYGHEKVNEITKTAIEENKLISIYIDPERLDYIEYHLNDVK
jgi:hypothetical protein